MKWCDHWFYKLGEEKATFITVVFHFKIKSSITVKKLLHEVTCIFHLQIMRKNTAANSFVLNSKKLFHFLLESLWSKLGLIAGQLIKNSFSMRVDVDWSCVNKFVSWFQGLLTEDATAAVKMLLPDMAEGDLAAVCSWADEIRHYYKWRWSGPLHYVDTPDFKCNYEYCSELCF